MEIKTLIIDDEPHAREGLKIRLSSQSEINIIGECSSGLEAIKSINELKPDLIFLDIQMPELDGFEVLQRINLVTPPIIVFVTAFDKYALKAFEYHALDYLLKPINDERLRETLKIVISTIDQRDNASYAAKLKKFVADLTAVKDNPFKNFPGKEQLENQSFINRLMIKIKDQITIFLVTDIEWIESAGDYVYIHSNGKKHLLRETLTALEQKLDPKQFIRIHRSTIVNVEKVKSLKQNEHGDYDVFLSNGIKLKLSRTYRNQFQNIIGNSF